MSQLRTGCINQLHHDKHHAAYVKGANDTLDKIDEARDKGDVASIVGLEKTLAFNLAGRAMHLAWWDNLSPDGGDKPDGELAAAIGEFFGSYDGLRAQLTAVANTVQGSGWGVLAWEPIGQRLVVHQALRPPREPVHQRYATAGVRLLGARVLPAVPQREAGLRREAVVHRELGGRGTPFRVRALRSEWTVAAGSQLKLRRWMLRQALLPLVGEGPATAVTCGCGASPYSRTDCRSHHEAGKT